MAYVEFAYNRALNSTTHFSLFDIVYGFLTIPKLLYVLNCNENEFLYEIGGINYCVDSCNSDKPLYYESYFLPNSLKFKLINRIGAI